MTVTADNAREMLFTLRYPPDKILDIFPGSFVATASSTPPFAAFRTNNAFDHNLGGSVFLQMIYSLDGGSTWQDQHVTVPDLTVPATPVLQTCEVGCYSTATQIVVVASNFTSTAKTVTYLVVAFHKEVV